MVKTRLLSTYVRHILRLNILPVDVFVRPSFTAAGLSILNAVPRHVRNSLIETVFRRSKLKAYIFQSTYCS